LPLSNNHSLTHSLSPLYISQLNYFFLLSFYLQVSWNSILNNFREVWRGNKKLYIEEQIIQWPKVQTIIYIILHGKLKN